MEREIEQHERERTQTAYPGDFLEGSNTGCQENGQLEVNKVSITLLNGGTKKATLRGLLFTTNHILPIHFVL